MSRLAPIAIDVLAGDTPRPTGPDFGKARPLGLLVVVLLLIGTLFLIRSMNRHLRKLPESFDRDNPGPDQAVDEGTLTDAAPSGDDREPRTRTDPDGAPHEPG